MDNGARLRASCADVPRERQQPVLWQHPLYLPDRGQAAGCRLPAHSWCAEEEQQKEAEETGEAAEQGCGEQNEDK